MCSGRAGAVLRRNWVPGTGSGWQVLRFRGPVPGTGYAFRWFRQVLLFQGSGFSFRETGFRTRGIAKVLGSEGCVPEVSKVSVFDEFRRVRFCSQGLDGTGSGNRVPGIRGIKKVPGLEIPLPRFRKLLCTYFESMLLYFDSKICTLKVNFCTLKVYFCTLKAYSCTLKVCFCTLKLYFCTLKVHFCTLKVYSCTLPQCLLQVALKISTARAKKRW